MIFLKIALLNLRSHPRRTAVIITAIALAVGIMETVAGMVDGMRNNFFTNMLEESGHIQVIAAGKEDSLDPFSIEHTLDEYTDIIDTARSLPGVEDASPFLTFGALLITEEKNIFMAGNGISSASGFNKSLDESIVKGSLNGIEDGVLISRETARLMKLDYGDTVIILVEDSEGAPYYLSFPVRGIYQTKSSDFDNMNLFMSIEQAQELLYLPGRASTVKLKLTDKDLAQTAAEHLAQAYAGMPVVIKTWRQIHGNFMLLIDLFDLFIYIMNLFTVIVAAAVITNSVLMNMFDRAREFGTMRAVGLKKSGLFALITTEGLSLGFLGSLAGLALGIPVVLYFQEYGLDFGAISESFGMGSAFYFHLTAKYIILNFASGILIALAGAAYAAWVIIRKSVIDTLSWR
ncbi:MAG: ABC transporter permease [Spirochaetales bacterium]|nr:ABC transporter permease [Spirochaetales bacterium]